MSRPLLGFVVAVVLTLAGSLRIDRAVERDEPGFERVVVIGVRGLSWNAVLDGLAGGDLPVLGRVTAGDHTAGDLLGAGIETPGAIHASLLTGTLPFKHGVADFTGGERLRNPARHHPETVWELLAERGHSVAVVSDPFWTPVAGAGALAIPDVDTLSLGFQLYRDGARVPSTEPWDGLWREAIAGAPAQAASLAEGLDLAEGLVQRLTTSVTIDLLVSSLARRAMSSSPRTHLFTYFDGLARLETALLDDSPGLHAEGLLLERYHRFLDRMVGRLAALDDTRTTYFLYSEEGNRGGPIDHRPHFPQLRHWPHIGFFLAWGSAVKSTVFPVILSPLDIAPTVLHIAGEPVRNHMDGVVQLGLLRDDFYRHNPPVFAR